MLKEWQDSATNENSFSKLKTAVLNLRIKINLHPKENNNFSFHAYHIIILWLLAESVLWSAKGVVHLRCSSICFFVIHVARYNCLPDFCSFFLYCNSKIMSLNVPVNGNPRGGPGERRWRRAWLRARLSGWRSRLWERRVSWERWSSHHSPAPRGGRVV